MEAELKRMQRIGQLFGRMSSKKNVKPPVAARSPGYDVVKQKLAKMGDGRNPELLLDRDRIKEQLFGYEYYERNGEEVFVKIGQQIICTQN